MANTTWYNVTDGGLKTLQRSLIPREADTKSQRSYSPTILPGLVQTHDYARAILTKCSAVLGLADDSEATALARLERKSMLDQPGHEFHMLIDERALRLTVAAPR
nr:Scr1 family TA system antitoxin-like transcriptional regulator [Nocardia sp. GTS18]